MSVQEFTLSLKMMATSTGGFGNPGNGVTLVGKHGLRTNCTPCDSLGIYYSNTGFTFQGLIAQRFNGLSGNFLSITSQHQFARDVWHDVALSLDRDVAGSRDLLQLFVDGQLEGSLTGDFLDIPFFNGTNSGNNFGDLLIGAGNYGGSASGNFRRNVIDPVRRT